MTSFNVSSLFTKAPTVDSISIIEEMLASRQRYSRFGQDPLTFFLREILQTDLDWRYGFSTIASILLEDFEAWLRYVHTFIIWPSLRHTLQYFLDHLNDQYPDIKFRMNIEK